MRIAAIAAKAAYDPPGVAAKTMAAEGYVDCVPFDRRGTQGFVARSDAACILSFRGTEPNRVEDWKSDLCATKEPGIMGLCHSGFLAALNDVWDAICPELDLRNLIVTGHSLGGALATLATARIALDKIESTCVTFGSPKVFDATGATYFDRICRAHTRFVHCCDVVPRLLPLTFRHCGEMAYIDRNGEVRRRSNWLTRGANRLSHMWEARRLMGIRDHSMLHYYRALSRRASL